MILFIKKFLIPLINEKLSLICKYCESLIQPYSLVFCVCDALIKLSSYDIRKVKRVFINNLKIRHSCFTQQL